MLLNIMILINIDDINVKYKRSWKIKRYIHINRNLILYKFFFYLKMKENKKPQKIVNIIS